MRNIYYILALVVLVVIGGIFLATPQQLDKPLPFESTTTTHAYSGEIVVDLVDGGDMEHKLQAIENLIIADLTWIHPESADEGIAIGYVENMHDALFWLNKDTKVELAEPNIELHAYAWPVDGEPNDPLYTKQWHMREIDAPYAWAHTPMGEGVVVAVLDTGVSEWLDDLKQTKFVPGASFIRGEETTEDFNGHGSHCAGTIAQSTNNGVGVTGVAPRATIMPVKVLSGNGSGSAASVAGGIDFAADNGADIISMSLGASRSSSVIHNAIKRAEKKGVLIVAAAGNSGRQGVGYPGAYKEVIGVSSIGPDRKLAYYSSWGKGVDIAGPGGNKQIEGGGVWQQTIDGQGGSHYAEYQGTSMACPHVAGGAAILMSTGLSADKTREVLLSSASLDEWDPKFGYGIMNLKEALAEGKVQTGLVPFATAFLISMLLLLVGVRSSGEKLAIATFAGLNAGGAFFLAYLPWDHLALDVLASPWLMWPMHFELSSWAMCPLWISAVLPFALVYVLTPFEKLRMIALGVAVGMGSLMFYGAVAETIDLIWLGEYSGAWLSLNAIACMTLALAVTGTEKLETPDEAHR